MTGDSPWADATEGGGAAPSETTAPLEVTTDLVRDLLREQHPDLAELSVRRVVGGWGNQMWRLGDDPRGAGPVDGHRLWSTADGTSLAATARLAPAAADTGPGPQR